MSNPRDAQTDQRDMGDGRIVAVYGLFTTGEGTGEPGDDGYDVWLVRDATDPSWTDETPAQHLNEGWDPDEEPPTDDEIREMLADYDASR